MRVHMLAAACVAAMVLVPGAAAATVVTLNGEMPVGEVLLGGSASIECNDEANSGTVSYRVTGVAAGPYPGTFEEEGTIVFENGESVSFSASFTIESGVTRIEGTKSFQSSLSLGCSASPDPTISTSASGDVVGRYEATIAGPSGTFTDHGVVGVRVSLVDSPFGDAGQVQEWFFSDREGATLELRPVEAVNPVGTRHTVTAALSDYQFEPLPGERVLFTVTGSVSASGECTTDAEGVCDFTYDGPEAAGADLITACYDFDRSGSPDPGERCSSATKVWLEPSATPGSATGGGYIGLPGAAERVAFGFTAGTNGEVLHAHCNVIDRVAGVHVRCLNATLLVISGTHATFYGTADVDGVITNYRIDVEDLGESGAGQDVFEIQTDTGYAAAGVLTAGNIQVRE